MKIGDRSGQSGVPGDRGGQSRAEVFKRAHVPGQKVRGRVVRAVSPGLCWVDIDGRELLAETATQAAEGAELIFRIVSLEPRIVLRELGPAGTAGRDGELDLLV